MKKLIGFAAVLVFMSLHSHAQKYQDALLYGKKENGLLILRNLGIPNDTLYVADSARKNPHISIKGTTFYVWDTLTKRWNAFAGGGGGGGGSVLQVDGGIGFEPISIITTGVLNIDTSFMETKAANKKTSDSLAALILLRLRISDTSSMLANYKHWLQGYLKAADIVIKLNISDTAAMLANYVRGQRLTDTAAAIRSAFPTTPGLDKVSAINKKTADIISVGGVRSNYYASDTLNIPDYEIVIMPDIQHMTQSYPAILRGVYKYLKDSASSRNIKAVLQVGDLAQTPTNAEMDTVKQNYLQLDAVGLPYLFVPGNHDYNSQAPAARDLTIYNTYLGPSFFSGKSFYGGHFGTDNANYWITFSAGTKKYLALGLEFLPRDTVISWAGHILDSFLLADPTREAMIVTHAYISAAGELAVDSTLWTNITYGMDATSNNGLDLWNKLIKKKANIRWVFNGHYLTPPSGGAPYRLSDRITATGENGNLINQIFVNFQEDFNGGNGFFLRLRFKPSEGTVTAEYFSPYLNAYDTVNQAYTMLSPTVTNNTSQGVAGDFSVNKDFRVAGDLKAEKMEKFSIPVVGADHALTTDGSIQEIGNTVYINNRHVVIGTDSARAQLLATTNPASTSMLYIVQPSTTTDTAQYGITIEKFGPGFDAPRLNFYKTAGDSSTQKKSTAGLNLGDIVYKGIATDNSTQLTAALVRVTQTDQSSSQIWAKYAIQIPAKSGTNTTAFLIQASSTTDINAYIGGPTVYGANYGSSYTSRTLTDKNYVDSAIAANAGSGGSLVNLGSGYKLAVAGTQNVKSLGSIYGIYFDSTGTMVTIGVDTADGATGIATQGDIDRAVAGLGGGGGPLTIGSSSITGGTSGNVLYHNGSVLGEMTTSGSGTVLALTTSPVFTTPNLGTPSAVVLTNATGTASSLTSGKASNLTGGNNTTLLGAMHYQSNTDVTATLSPNTTTTKQFLTQTGTGTNGAAPAWGTIVNADVPSALTGKTYNALTLTANATGFQIAGGTTSKTMVISNSLTFAGTDATTMTFPGTSASIARTDAAQTFTGVQTFSSTISGSINGNAATVTTNANLTGDVTSTGNATTYNNVVPAAKGGAGTINGLLKANGSGTVSAAAAGTDYLAPFGSQTANSFYAAPNGSAGTPSFRAVASADLPVFTGDAGSGGTKGAVPAPASGDAAAGKFLKSDGTWAAPPGAGGGEANSGQNVGGGIAVYDTKVSLNLQFRTFNANHFDSAGTVISLDTVNGPMSSSTGNGFMRAIDFKRSYSAQSISNPTGTWTYDVDAGGQADVSLTSTGGRTLAFSNRRTGDVVLFRFNNTSGATITLTLPSNSFVDNTTATTMVIPTGRSMFSLSGYDGTNSFFSSSSGNFITGLTLEAGTTSVAPVTYTASGASLLTTAAQGSQEVDAAGLLYYTTAASSRGVVKAEQFISLTSTYTLTSQTAAQKLFNSSTNGALTVQGSTSYYFECEYSLSSMSATSGSYGFAIGGTATLTSIEWQSYGLKAATLTTAATAQTTFNTTAANTTLVTASTSTNGHMMIKGIIRVNATGTIIPRVSLGIAAAAVVGVNSWFRIYPIGTNTITNLGNWN